MFPAFGVTNFNSALSTSISLSKTTTTSSLCKESWVTSICSSPISRAIATSTFTPDKVGDIIFNGVASDVERSSLVNGVQGDGSYRFNDANTLRSGFFVSGERRAADSVSTVLPLDPIGDPD